MRAISGFADQELVWVQPARMKQAFELRASDDVVATLQFERSSLANGEAGEQRWTFKREGFWHPHVTVRVADSDDNVALFKPAWSGGGSLELSQGRLLRFGAANFWHSQWDWSDVASQSPLVHFKSHAGLLKTEGQVDIEAAAVPYPELSLLVVLGWYLLILFGRDSAAAAGASAAVVAAH
ncbi:MAG: hypothetical protein M3003_08830 [Candidatus Dormibacteraeota bacterium]|nr:hypothetical protein [Candidatus Dormibacteraeota bacterium]MDQ6921599.1 hypothetical protein [Candidatus Dormibacteraeota bacterium]